MAVRTVSVTSRIYATKGTDNATEQRPDFLCCSRSGGSRRLSDIDYARSGVVRYPPCCKHCLAL